MKSLKGALDFVSYQGRKMAVPIWNYRSVVGPPVVLLRVEYNIGERAFIQQYKDILNDIDIELRLLQVLEKEIWIAKRYSYKYQNSDGNMKWFRQQKMISKACESLIELQLNKLVIPLIPETVGETYSGIKPNKWPSRQMLEYFLVKLLGFASLCVYIWSLGYKTNELLLQNMEVKNLFLRNLLQTGYLSRMQIITQHLVEKCCKWYTGLYPWLQRLPELESNWLPEGVTLPSTVEEAVGDELTELRNIASLIVPKKKKQNTLQRFFNLHQDTPVPELHEEFDKSIPDTGGVVRGVTHTGLSLDAIFSGLVEAKDVTKDLGDKSEKTSNVSKTIPLKPESTVKTGTDHLNGGLAERETFVSSEGLVNEENRPREGEETNVSHQVQPKPKKKKKRKRHSEIDQMLSNHLHQSEDIGVAVSAEEMSSESKTKKQERNKKLKRKDRDEEGKVKNDEETASKRRKTEDNSFQEMEGQSMKGSTHYLKTMSNVIFTEEDSGIAAVEASLEEKDIDVNTLSQGNGLDRRQNQNKVSEVIASDFSKKKRKKKKKKYLQESTAEDFIPEKSFFDEKEADGKREKGEEKISTPMAMNDHVEFTTKTVLGLSDTVKKKKKKRKKKISLMPDSEGISSPMEDTFRESSQMGEISGIDQMSQNEQTVVGESTQSKIKKRKRNKNKDETVEVLNVNDGLTSKEEKSLGEILEVTGTDLSNALEVGKERNSKKKKKKKKNLVGSTDVESVGKPGILGMEGVREPDADKKSIVSVETRKIHPDRTKGIHSKAFNDVNEINLPSKERNNQNLQQKFQGKVKKKRKKNKKGWKTAFQFMKD